MLLCCCGGRCPRCQLPRRHAIMPPCNLTLYLQHALPYSSCLCSMRVPPMRVPPFRTIAVPPPPPPPLVSWRLIESDPTVLCCSWSCVAVLCCFCFFSLFFLCCPCRRPNHVHHSGRGKGDHRHHRVELKNAVVRTHHLNAPSKVSAPSTMHSAATFWCAFTGCPISR